jgi:AraC-like DNA-binding protein
LSTAKRTDAVPGPVDGAAGLFRTLLAGPGQTLADAFANLERSPLVEHVTRHLTHDLLRARVALSVDEGSGYWDFIRVRDELFVIVENFAYKNPRVERMGGDGLIQFSFRLSGDLTLGVTQQQPLRLNRPSLLVWKHSPGIEVPEWTAPSAHERAVAISVRPQFLVERFLGSTVNAPERLQAFVASARGQVNYLQLPLTPAMFELATKLVDNPHNGTLSLVYTEAVAMELLCEAISGLQGVASAPHEQYTQRDLRCLDAARRLLLRQFAPPPTIRQVARSAGMNETTLKRGFKAVFGETIFDFSIRCRMQHALKLLREQQMPVARVAEAVGYSHQTSFATAFRRHFGMRPREVRGAKTIKNGP